MNREEHIFIGIVIFFVYNFFNNTIINAVLNPTIGFSIGTSWLIGVIIAVIGSVIPDILEPATHWTHRSTFHSRITLGFTGKIFAATAIIGLFTPIFFYISCFFLGYEFHLLADSTTTVGLP
ncbi:MAG: hypothetical protein WC379_06205 [Methanoregula sp.]|jgi:hypothetical protein